MTLGRRIDDNLHLGLLWAVVKAKSQRIFNGRKKS